jgi:hypothetical protein
MLIPTSPEEFVRSVDSVRAERRRQRDLERASDTRQLEPPERYRALIDHYEYLQDESEQVDRTTRFALIILGGLNAINLAIVLRGAEAGLPIRPGGLVSAYVACYTLLSLGVFCYAISALRPRTAGTPLGSAGGRRETDVRMRAAVLSVGVEDYCGRWGQVRFADLNSEVAVMSHGVAAVNELKRRALGRVYGGLYLLVGLTAVLLTILGVRTLAG